MKENDNIDYMFDDSEEMQNIDFGKYFNILRSHWKKLLLWTIIGFVIGCLIALGTPRKYVCTSMLAPELSNTATSRLSSMASMIGYTSSVLGTTDAVYPMVYPDLVHSPEFIADLFETHVEFVDRKDSVSTDLYDYLVNYRRKSVVGEVLGAPMKAMSWVKDLFIPEEETVDSLAPVNPASFTKEQGRIYLLMSKSIEAEIDKKTLVVTIQTKMDNKFVCAQLSRAVNDNLKKYVTKYRTEKAVHERDYYRELYLKSQRDYYTAQDKFSRYVDTHQGLVLQSVITEREKLHNEANLQYQLYNNNAQQLQTAEAKVLLDTPVFAEVVTPTVPLKSANSKKKIALAFAFLSLFIGMVSILWKNRNEEESEI